VIWDNRCALHSATGGYPIEEKRIHWRVTIMQDAAFSGQRGRNARHDPAGGLLLSFGLVACAPPVPTPDRMRRRARAITSPAARRS